MYRSEGELCVLLKLIKLYSRGGSVSLALALVQHFQPLLTCARFLLIKSIKGFQVFTCVVNPVTINLVPQELPAFLWGALGMLSSLGSSHILSSDKASEIAPLCEGPTNTILVLIPGGKIKRICTLLFGSLESIYEKIL